MDNITKDHILAFVKSAINDGLITKRDLLDIIESSANISENQSKQDYGESTRNFTNPKINKFSIVDILQYVGGFIIFAGLIVFVALVWVIMNPFMRILVTSGTAIIAYILGSVLLQTDRKTKAGIIFHVISAIVFPFALYVIISELFMLSLNSALVSIITLTLLLLYAVSFYIFRHPVFTFFMLIYSVSFVYAGIYTFVPGISASFISYITLIVGAIGIFIGYSFKETENESLSWLVYFFGSSAILASSASLFDSSFLWEVAYPFLLAYMFYLSLKLHSKSILLVSAFALVSYIMYITSEYFADALGWPVALIFAGIALVALGYMLVNFKNKI